jgi:3-dehydroquinate dehydratase/shikimate dehydrogenase
MALDACENGEDFLEIRLDLLDLPEAGIAIIRRLLRRYPDTAILATCRRRANGGGFSGTIDQELDLLDAAVTAGAAAVDVEIETAEAAPARLEPFRDRTRLLISYHNFERTPSLQRILQRLHKIPADIYKVTTMGLKPSDNLRVLDLLRSSSGKPLVAMVMGEVGMPSRILGPSRKALFVFASAESKPQAARKRGKVPKPEPTAPGQISASVLRNRYQAHRRTSSVKVYGVIACPVAHSLSPALHNRAFQARRLDAVFLPFLVEPTKLGDFFKLVEPLRLAGFSVTIPHKLRVIRHLDSVDSLAKRIGAVNTVYRCKGKLYGANTDVLGVIAPLEKRMTIRKSSVLVVGNGGAARGAIFALLDKGARVTLTGRDPRRVAALARACGVEAMDRAKAAAAHFDVLVHATPLGMHPNVDESFFSDRVPADLVFDMVYNPIETRLLRQARAAGRETIPGIEMFTEQAAAQFEIWTGEKAPRTIMRNAVLEALGA